MHAFRPTRTLAEMGDTMIASPLDGQVLTWSAAAGRWVPAAPAAGGGAAAFAAQNKGTAPLPAGAPVAADASGSGVAAAAAADAGRPALGLLAAPAAPGFAAPVVTAGTLALPDWSAAAGTATLAPKAVYYLGTAPGTMTTVSPAGAGQVSQRVGVAVAPDTLEVQVAAPFLT